MVERNFCSLGLIFQFCPLAPKVLAALPGNIPSICSPSFNDTVNLLLEKIPLVYIRYTIKRNDLSKLEIIFETQKTFGLLGCILLQKVWLTSLARVMTSGWKLTFSFNCVALGPPPRVRTVSIAKILPLTPRLRCCTLMIKSLR